MGECKLRGNQSFPIKIRKASLLSKNRYNKVKYGIALINLIIIFISLLVINLYFSLPFKTMIYAGEEYIYSIAIPFLNDNAAQNAQPINPATQPRAANISFQKALKVSSNQPGDYKLDIKVFGAIPLKTMEISVLPKDSVIPLGTSVGVKIELDGVLVINVSDVKAIDGKSYSPAKESGLKNGDIITGIDDTPIRNVQRL